MIVNSFSENIFEKNMEKISVQKNDVMSDLTELWRNVLGIKEIGLDDDFDSLGGHSLLAISLLEKIRKTFGFKVSQSAFLKVKAIRGLSNIIQSATQENGASPLVTLQQDGSKAPLFMLHPVGGTVFCMVGRYFHRCSMIKIMRDLLYSVISKMKLRVFCQETLITRHFGKRCSGKDA